MVIKYLRILLLIFFLVACKNQREETIPATAAPGETAVSSTTIPDADDNLQYETTTIQFAIKNAELAYYETLALAFEEERPDITIKLVAVEEILGLDNSANLSTIPANALELLARKADVFSGRYAGDDAREQFLRDLTPFIQADAGFNREDFYPNALPPSGEPAYILPTALYFDLIAYDKTLFDAAGLEYPQPGWIWDDFRAMAQTLTLREGDETSQWGFVNLFDSLSLLEAQLTGPLVDGTVAPPRPRFQDEDVATAVRWYIQLLLVDRAAPYTVPETMAGEPPPDYALIEAGQAAMWIEPSNSWALRRQMPDMTLGIAPYPAGINSDHQATSPLFVDGLVMSAGSANPAAAWEWMAFLSRQAPPTTNLNNEPSFLPARASVAAASGFWDDVSPELGAALRYAVEHSYPARLNGDNQILREAINQILSGNKSISVALADAQAQAEAVAGRNPDETTGEVEPFTIISETALETNGSAVAVNFVTFRAYLRGTFRDIADQFEQDRPGIRIALRSPTLVNDPNVPYFVQLAENYDCFEGVANLQNPIERTAVLNLEPFIAADPSFNMDDFYPAMTAQFTYRGQIWGLPSQVNPIIIEYNKDMFDAAGIEYPAYDWTMEDFLKTAIALTKGEGEDKQYGFIVGGDGYEGWLLTIMLERLGAKLLDERVDPPTLALTNPATTEAMRWYANLTTEYGVKPVFAADPNDLLNMEKISLREQIAWNSRAAMWIGETPRDYGYGPFAGGVRPTLNLGGAPLPQAPGGGSGLPTATGYFISTNASPSVRQACWQWINFLTTTPEVIDGLPGRRSVAQSDAYRQQVGPGRADAYVAIVAGPETSEAPAVFSGWMRPGIDWLSRAYDQITKGELAVEDALQIAQENFDTYRFCLIANDAFNDSNGRYRCIKQVDPTYPTHLISP